MSFLLFFLLSALSVEACLPLALAFVGLSFASAVQGLRVLWRRSRVLAILVGLGIPSIPLFGLWMSVGDGFDPWQLLLWLPAGLALAVELRVRAVRRSQGLPEVEPVEAPGRRPPDAARTPSRASGCLVGLGLLALFAGYFAITLQAPRAAAAAFKERLHVGMTLSDVMVESLGTPRHLVFVRSAAGAPEWTAFGSTVRMGRDIAEGAAAVRALLERRAAELRVKSITFMFLASIPVHSSIVVRFGPDGRVEGIEGPFDRAE